MKVLIINPPHTAIGSRILKEHLPPLGLLCIAGPLVDFGFDVSLLDADRMNMSVSAIFKHTREFMPDCVLLGHSGSSSAHPKVIEIVKAVKTYLPEMKIIYGGVYPTFHYRKILINNPEIDFIVRGEGEETILELMKALKNNQNLCNTSGIAYRKGETVIKTQDSELLTDLDKYRIPWELIDFDDYSYWGGKRATVIQFSRGCPHQCTYCGQHKFWKKWRHRDPEFFAKEIAYLHQIYGVEVFDFADENPIADRKAWIAFLKALISYNLPIILIGSARADDIVRDKDILHLYKKAGFERFLMGIENYDSEVLEKIQKKGTPLKDQLAIQYLRKNNIISLATYVVGFKEESIHDFIHSYKQLLKYDPDQIQIIFASPHRWTHFFQMIKKRNVIQEDLCKWDYKHQVLETKNLKPWLVFSLVKIIEVLVQLRLRALKRLFFHPDKSIRKAFAWYYRIGKKVWFHEIWNFLFKDKFAPNPQTLSNFWCNK